MIDPNICKMVYANVELNSAGTYLVAYYDGQCYEVLTPKEQLKVGRRRLYVKYSIVSDSWYFTKKA